MTPPVKSQLPMVNPEDSDGQALDTLGLTIQTLGASARLCRCLQGATIGTEWMGHSLAQKQGDVQRTGGSHPEWGDRRREGGPGVGHILIPGTSSQGVLSALLIPHWFSLSRWGVKFLSPLDDAVVKAKPSDKRP